MKNLKNVRYFKVIDYKKVLVVFKDETAKIIYGKITNKKLISGQNKLLWLQKMFLKKLQKKKI